jgi:hypothetical protein
VWWGNVEQRRIQKERIKNKIKQTKMTERSGVLSGKPVVYRIDAWLTLRLDPFGHTRSVPVNPPMSPEYDFNRPLLAEPPDLFSSHLPTPAPGQVSTTPYGPYEIDVKTERQTFVNDVPLRHDSAISTFSSFGHPQLSAPLPAFPGEEDLLPDEYLDPGQMFGGVDQTICEPSIGQSYSMLQANIPVSDDDRPLLDHFIHNVLRLIFPVLEINQRGYTRAEAILHALETNKCYLHCCLSVAAIHLKTTEGLVGEQVDHDIVRHRYEAVSQLCQALGQDINHHEILDATLAMIFFHCAVGSSDDYLPDIPWYDHFQAASNLVHRLELPAAIPDGSSMLPPFSMTLASWIDILGSTMMGKTPHFAHAYRSKHLTGSSLGFRELMGCDDRVMYLISEIACLDALKHEGRIDGLEVCSHVSALGAQLEYTEPPDQTLEDPISPVTNTVRPDILSKNMSMIFRTAARIYLCSLVPGYDRRQPSNLNLVCAVTSALQYIPSGPNGFDRSLVWPLLITGAFSTPDSQFRTVLEGRVAALSFHADLGSFGRMYRVLQEVWRAIDGAGDECSCIPAPNDENPADPALDDTVLKQEKSASPDIDSSPAGETKQRDLHWREIMRKNDWHYLLI